MNRNIKLLLGAAIAAIIIVGAGSFWAGNIHASKNIGIEHVTIAQLGDAMQQDNFYSNYGSSALLFNGDIVSFQNGINVTLVTFASNRPYGVICQFPTHIAVKAGQTISVITTGGSAERQKAGVLLHDCNLN